MNTTCRKTWRCLPLLLAVAACSSSPATHFYMLKSGGQAAISRSLPGGTPPRIGIAPVDFPAYLDRPQIMTRTGSAEILLSEIHRWAEPLRDNFARVLAANLSRMLDTAEVGIEPSRLRVPADYRLAVDVRQFDASHEGEVVLVAYWSLSNSDDPDPVMLRRSEISLTIARRGDYAGMVEALSEAVARLSLEIAAAIRGLPPA